ncbi:MAG: hypothetical protein KGL10_00620 [Alphaproteobacteria bacterium]|nr:hypothetical protein [Alphaproteobacteria bacterium]
MGFIFGRKTKEAAPLPEKAPALNFYDIGKNGTVEEFHAANKRALRHVTMPQGYDFEREFIKHLGGADQESLRAGALDAFFEGRPENLLEVIRHPREFAVKGGYVSAAKLYDEDSRATVVTEIVRRSERLKDDIALVLKGFEQNAGQEQAQKSILFALDQAAVLEKKPEVERLFLLSVNVAAGATDPQKAVHDTFGRIFAQAVSVSGKEAELEECVRFVLAEGVPPEDVQEALNHVLYGVVCKKGTEAAVRALLDVGAEANAALGDGYKGRVLATAVKNELSPAIVEMLHKGGADFADALYLMKSKPDEGWSDAVKQGLNVHAKRITGKAVEKEAPPADVLRQLAELRDEMTKVKADLASAKAEISQLKSGIRRRPSGPAAGPR